MRVIEGEAIGKMIIPEEVVFAFNPNRVTVYSQEDNINVIIGSYTDKRETHGGMCVIDVSKYLQLQVSETNRHADVEVKVTDEANTYTFNLHVIWGAINIGETFNKGVTLRWWPAFPMTMEYYAAAGAIVKTRYDRVAYGAGSTVETGGLVSVNPSDVFQIATEQVVIRVEDGEVSSSFDYTFDGTFRAGGEGVHIHKLVIDDCDRGIYIRWIDRHGFMRYWLFDEGDTIVQDKAGDKLMAIREDVSGHEFVQGIYMSKSATKSVKVCAPLVTLEEMEVLGTIATSPYVEIYLPASDNWMRVNIEPLTVTKKGVKERRPLVDFECMIGLPDLITQKL